MKLLYGECAIANIPFELEFEGVENAVIFTGRAPSKKLMRVLRGSLKNYGNDIPVVKGEVSELGNCGLIIAAGGQAVLNIVKDTGKKVYFIPAGRDKEIYEIPPSVTLIAADARLFKGKAERLINARHG